MFNKELVKNQLKVDIKVLTGTIDSYNSKKVGEMTPNDFAALESAKGQKRILESYQRLVNDGHFDT